MDFSGWDMLFNLLITAFWFGAWSTDSRYAFFNSYLRPMHTRFDAIFAFLRPAFLNAPDRVIALVFVGILIVLRALAAPPGAVWELALGAAPAGIGVQCHGGSIPAVVAWSVLSIALFFFKFWSLCVLYLGFARRPDGQVQTALHSLTAPFSWLPPMTRPPLVLVLGLSCGVLLQRFDGAPFTLLSTLRALLAVVSAWTLLIGILQQAVFILIIGGWIGAGSGSDKLRWMCAEWIDLLIGPLRGRPIVIGMFDVTPLLFFFVLGIVRQILIAVVNGAASLLP